MGGYFSTESRPDTGLRKEYNSDVLGDEGRKVLNACVKVKIYGKPETRKYDSQRAQRLFEGCYARLRGEAYEEFNSYVKKEKTYSIVEIYNAVVKYDDMPYVRIYPEEGSGSEEMRELIDKRRADVERESEEAEANSDGKKMYSWTVARRRVRDCYAGNFPEDETIMDLFYPEPLTIKVIEKVFRMFDGKSSEIFSDQTKITDEKALAHRATIQKKYHTALVSPGLYKPSEEEGRESFKKCYSSADRLVSINFNPHVCSICGYPDFCIFYFYDQLCKEDMRLLKPCKYPAEGPGSKELRESIDRNRADLQKEYQNFCDHEESWKPDHTYSREEAVRRVRDCFACGIVKDGDVFPTKKDESGRPKIYQTYDIFDIKRSLEHFDLKQYLDKYLEIGHISDDIKKRVDEQRAHIRREYEIATTSAEIEHGSGFVISDHFILINKHVIETCLNKKDFEICISNMAISELHCKVAYTDPGKDLALLYCPDLKLPQSKVSPLQLSTQPLLPGMQIFSFGYPMSHTEETALFVTGNVSGSKRTLSGHSKVVLNCSLNSGNSGGPVLAWVDGQARVVGIATQKHFKEILTFDEIDTIENIRKSLQTRAITDASNFEEELSRQRGDKLPDSCQVSMHLLTLKLYDALETHSQFNLSNALPGDLVVDFIKDVFPTYKGEHKEELAKVIQLSQ